MTHLDRLSRIATFWIRRQRDHWRSRHNRHSLASAISQKLKLVPERFDISPDTMVVTSTYITEGLLPVLEVSVEDDEEGGSLWQFHSGNGDYDMARMQLVRLDTILGLDPRLCELASLRKGQVARRLTFQSPWVIS